MPNSPTSSPGSAPCRLEWRPSRWLLALLALISGLAPAAVLAGTVAVSVVSFLVFERPWREVRLPARPPAHTV